MKEFTNLICERSTPKYYMWISFCVFRSGTEEQYQEKSRLCQEITDLQHEVIRSEKEKREEAKKLKRKPGAEFVDTRLKMSQAGEFHMNRNVLKI